MLFDNTGKLKRECPAVKIHHTGIVFRILFKKRSLLHSSPFTEYPLLPMRVLPKRHTGDAQANGTITRSTAPSWLPPRLISPVTAGAGIRQYNAIFPEKLQDTAGHPAISERCPNSVPDNFLSVASGTIARYPMPFLPAEPSAVSVSAGISKSVIPMPVCHLL